MGDGMGPPCKHSSLMNPYPCDSCTEIAELEDRLFKIKQIGDRLFMHANMLAIKDRTPELDAAIMAWADVHKGNI